LDPILARPRVLGLIVTHQCTAACDHCCYACNPRVTERIPPKRLAELIDEAREIPSIGSIGFTGGEPFLLGQELDELIARARSHGFLATCNTNAYWAVNPKAARERVRRLRDAGLTVLSISTGTMHSRYVPVERVVNAAVAAYDAGIGVAVSIEKYKGSKFNTSALTLHPAIKGLRRRRGFDIDFNPWIPNAAGVGKAQLRHTPSYSRFRRENISPCEVVLDIIAVKPDMTLTACCGLPIESIPELALGSVSDKSLGDAIAKARDDFLKIWLHVAGPERMLRFVKRYLPNYQLPIESAHPCQTCFYLHNDPIALRVLREHQDEVEAKITARYLRMRKAVARSPVRYALPTTRHPKLPSSSVGNDSATKPRASRF
jgi:hypothetical protein